jgi:two-component system chemotaxis response regulator CheY
MNVLVVDDNAGTRGMIKIILERTGHKVVGEAGDGDSAVKAFCELRPEVVLLDIIMPGKSGVEVLQEIRAIDPAAKVVLVTAVDQDEVSKELLAKGAAAIIYKPFSYDDFGKVLKKIA